MKAYVNAMRQARFARFWKSVCRFDWLGLMFIIFAVLLIVLAVDSLTNGA